MEFERKRHNHSYMNIAPLVDVVFLLLLFFMLTSHLIQEPAVKIKLPESETAMEEGNAVKTITITKGGEIFFMERRVDLAELRNALKEVSGLKETIRIRADREASVGILIRVVDAIRLSGVSSFSIVTEKA